MGHVAADYPRNFDVVVAATSIHLMLPLLLLPLLVPLTMLSDIATVITDDPGSTKISETTERFAETSKDLGS